MREYTAKEMKLLKANPYTFKVTKNKLYFTVEFKEAFWTAYQARMAPRKILKDLGYDLEMFGQKQIDSMVQSIKRQAQSGDGFRQGENRTRRKKDELCIPEGTAIESQEALAGILNEVKYLRQEVEFLKKLSKRKIQQGGNPDDMCMVHWDPPVVMNLKKIWRLMDKYGLMCPVRTANPYRRMAKALKTDNAQIIF